MSLHIELRPFEKIYLNGAVIANGDARSSFAVLNDAALLREKDILTEEMADSPCKRIYLALQLIYMDAASRARYLEAYSSLKAQVLEAAPSTATWFEEIDTLLGDGRHYQALKAARGLINYEQELINHVK